MAMDYALIHRLSRDGLDSRDSVSAAIGDRLQWDAAWLARHCRGRSSGACRLIGGRAGGAAGSIVANAPRVANRYHHGQGLPRSGVYVGRRTPLGNPDPKPQDLSLEAELLARGWIVVDDLGREILTEAPKRFKRAAVLRGLDRELASGEPTYALEGLGAALGEEWECPAQLVRIGGDHAPRPGLPDLLGDYRRWLHAKITGGDEQVIRALRAITPATLLVCSCWPRPCHADVIQSAWCWMRDAGMLGT